MATFLSVLLTITALVLIVAVMVQETSQAGLGTIDGGASGGWGAHRGTSRDEMLNRVTVISSVVFFVAIMILNKL